MDRSFMIGVTGETAEDMWATFRLIGHLRRRQLGAMGGISITGPQIYRPYPGCELYNAAVAHGLRVPGSLRDWARVMAGSVSDYIDLEQMPWIKEKEKAAISLIKLALADLSALPTWKGLLCHLVQQALQLREIVGFRGFPVEYHLYKTFHWLKHQNLTGKVAP